MKTISGSTLANTLDLEAVQSLLAMSRSQWAPPSPPNSESRSKMSDFFTEERNLETIGDNERDHPVTIQENASSPPGKQEPETVRFFS